MATAREELEYRASFPPNLSDPADIMKWVFEELTRVQNAISLRHRFPVLYAEPAKKFTGMVVYADGTTWDPGSGEGVYAYSSGGSWVKL